MIWFPLILCIAFALLDCFGYLGPSDGAIDAYWKLKETNPRKARKFLKEIMK